MEKILFPYSTKNLKVGRDLIPFEVWDSPEKEKTLESIKSRIELLEPSDELYKLAIHKLESDFYRVGVSKECVAYLKKEIENTVPVYLGKYKAYFERGRCTKYPTRVKSNVYLCPLDDGYAIFSKKKSTKILSHEFKHAARMIAAKESGKTALASYHENVSEHSEKRSELATGGGMLFGTVSAILFGGPLGFAVGVGGGLLVTEVLRKVKKHCGRWWTRKMLSILLSDVDSVKDELRTLSNFPLYKI